MRRPDAAWVSPEQLERQRDSGIDLGVGGPAIVIEVLSPSDRHGATQAKVSQWLDSGAGVVLVAEPRFGGGTVCVYRADSEPRVLHADEVFEAPDVAPGLRIPIRSLFAD